MMEIFRDEEEKPQVTMVPEFDPNKKYRWTPETEFVLKGAEFANLLNAVRAIVSTEQAQTILAASSAGRDLESLLKKAVEEGRAVETQ